MNPTEIDQLVWLLDCYREVKNYAAADKLRNELRSIRVGMYRVELSTGKEGTQWHWTAAKEEVK